MIRIVLVDDQALVRSGFAMVIDSQEDMQVVGECGDGTEVLPLLATTSCDLIVMDIRARETGEHRAELRDRKTNDRPDLRGGIAYIDSPRHANYVESHTYQAYLADLRDRLGWPDLDHSYYDDIRPAPSLAVPVNTRAGREPEGVHHHLGVVVLAVLRAPRRKHAQAADQAARLLGVGDRRRVEVQAVGR